MGNQLYSDLSEKLSVIAGPCVIENAELCWQIAESLKRICDKLGIQLVFKASFDKANRTSINSFRGPGLEKGLQILADIKEKYRVPVITDVHETYQVSAVEEIVDIIQIPAFLCRQTDLLVAAAKTQKIVNIKKGQFLSAPDLIHAAHKMKSSGCEKILLTERGNSFGYNNLIVDFRNVIFMKKHYPVVMDITHSVQKIGSFGDKSGGDAFAAPFLAYAAGVMGTKIFFVETHPNPCQALSDGSNMIPLDQMGSLLENLQSIAKTAEALTPLSF